MDSYRVVKVENGNYLRLRIRQCRRIPYDEIVSLLVEGNEVFIPGMDRRVAHYVKKRLSHIIGTEVIAIPSEYRGEHGYAFRVSLIDKFFGSDAHAGRVNG